MLEFQAGETKDLNVALMPVASQPVDIAIEQLFIGTQKLSSQTGADCTIYIGLVNKGAGEVSGTVYIYDWQAWWGNAPGDDRRWITANFTLAPNGVFRCQDNIHELAFDETYIRVEVVVNDVVIAETPRVYIVPGKKYIGSERIAVGECTYKEPGHFVLWYSQYGVTRSWRGSYRTPPLPEPYIHRASFGRFDTYDRQSWEAVFIPIFDPEIIPGATYEANIKGGPTAWREVYFTFIAV
jgi:hypothetical protein